MHPLAIGFWGAFFGAVALLLAGALAAFLQANRRVGLAGALTALLAALFVVAFLGWLPVADPALEARLMAHIGIFIGLALWFMLLLDLGLLRETALRRRILTGGATVAVAAVAAAWLVDPRTAVAYGNVLPFVSTAAALPVAIYRARQGDRIAWVGALAILSLLAGLAGGLWIALDRAAAPWQVHAAAAVAGISYLACVGVMLWLRYSYLIELRQVRVLGPRYDPVTRMRSNAATGQMVAQAFQRQQQHDGRPVVLVAVSVGNLYALENLHGRAALNHALFVCASRLRHCVPPDIEMGRLSDDAFLLVSRNARDLEGLVKLGRVIARRLSRPLTLRTDAAGPQEQPQAQTSWAAQVGVGLLATTSRASPSAVVAKVRDMSRTAWTFDSHVAWLDQASALIAEVPSLEPA